MNVELVNAILKFNPETVVIRGGIPYDAEGNEVAYDIQAVNAYVQSQAYKQQRATKYPSVADQLDTLYHGGYDAWKATITAVKEEFPKP